MFRYFYILLFLFVVESSLLIQKSFPRPSTLGVSDTANVTVYATIPYCPFIFITPENRIPPTGNNALEIKVEVRPENTATPIYTATIGTNNDGQGSLCPIPYNLITNEYYDVLVKGLSHLKRIFPHQRFNGNSFTLDLRKPVLYAGDSHPSSDNYVNSMDVSYEVNNIYASGLRPDLNRDSKVNSLEFPTLISHFYKYGDN